MAPKSTTPLFHLLALLSLLVFLALSNPVDARHSSWVLSHARKSLEASKRDRTPALRRDLIGDVVNGVGQVISSAGGAVSQIVGGEYLESGLFYPPPSFLHPFTFTI